MDIAIINRGRGPEIADTRITVYDVLDYADHWSPEAIANLFRIETEQVLAAQQYIDEHREEVMAEYREILDRCARGNPPEVQTLVDQLQIQAEKLREIHRRSRERFRELIEIRKASFEQYRSLLDQYYEELVEEEVHAEHPG